MPPMQSASAERHGIPPFAGGAAGCCGKSTTVGFGEVACEGATANGGSFSIFASGFVVMTSTFEGYHWTNRRWDNRDTDKEHPFRLYARMNHSAYE